MHSDEKPQNTKPTIRLISPETANRLADLPPDARERVLAVAGKLLARYLKRRSAYSLSEERIETQPYPRKQATWTPPVPYDAKDGRRE